MDKVPHNPYKENFEPSSKRKFRKTMKSNGPQNKIDFGDGKVLFGEKSQKKQVHVDEV